MYFQITILINIGPKYLALISTILKDLKNETINLAEVVLRIMRYFEFMKNTEKSKSVLQISTSKPIPAALKKLCKNLDYIENSIIIH